MPRYGLATIFEPHAVGHEFTVDDLPLHLTHIDSFEAAMNLDELTAKLRKALLGQKALTVKALSDELYGQDKNIPVTTLELTPELRELHDKLIHFLDKEGIVLRNPQFNGGNFTPHISIYGSKRIIPGTRMTIKDISLATKVSNADDANRRVVTNIVFS